MPVQLTPEQRRNAQLIYAAGIHAGLSSPRAHELQAAAYAESTLRTRAHNPSGASGLFQLLSSGYVNRANRMGGVYNPQANINAILPDYVSYWRSHPNAAPGEAGRDVERSGEGAGFYANPLSIVSSIGSGGGATAAGAPVSGSPPGLQTGPAPDLRSTVLASLASGRPVDFLSLVEKQSALQKAAGSTPTAAGPTQRRAIQKGPVSGSHAGGLAEAFYDPLGSWDNGRFGGAIGGHSDHVHLSITNPQSMLSAIAYANAHGLHVGENPYVDHVDPVHVKGSFHYRDFPGRYGGKQLGEAIDVSGSPSQMAAYYKWAVSHLR